jgi:hypothetical protein
LVWRSATTLPMVIDRTASTHSSGRTTSLWPAKPMRISSSRATNPAAFDDTDKKAVMGVGEPSYVSGAHVWNGTADTLNPNPAMQNTTASVIIGTERPAASASPMSTSLVLPATP